uniref:Uncharacterized protein n=1 Tax=Rangifer tarandus platyrhynchus TaxID=3082113 RepID=A0ACB0FGK6_RANTA|nr:unnamed protein product [Rangifer tarandus platyrhynchus]
MSPPPTEHSTQNQVQTRHGWQERKADLPSHPHAACGQVPAGQSRARGFTRPSLAGGAEHSAEAWAGVRLALQILRPALVRTGAQLDIFCFLKQPCRFHRQEKREAVGAAGHLVTGDAEAVRANSAGGGGSACGP